ncbi:MAG: hypothetical protein GY866_24880 [Proteobacteria bacterium]|nr:hypothetical protein [Pseudomonadota bacterium]
MRKRTKKVPIISTFFPKLPPFLAWAWLIWTGSFLLSLFGLSVFSVLVLYEPPPVADAIPEQSITTTEERVGKTAKPGSSQTESIVVPVEPDSASLDGIPASEKPVVASTTSQVESEEPGPTADKPAAASTISRVETVEPRPASDKALAASATSRAESEEPGPTADKADAASPISSTELGGLRPASEKALVPSKTSRVEATKPSPASEKPSVASKTSRADSVERDPVTEKSDPVSETPVVVSSKIYTVVEEAGLTIKADWERITVSGLDSEGKTAEMEVYVLSTDFTWKFGSSSEVLYHRKPASLVKHLQSKVMQQAVAKSQAIVCVGTASQEGSSNREEDRARQRADQLVFWLMQTKLPIDEIYSLNLGQHQKADAVRTTSANGDPTGYQRSIVFINIIHRDKDTDLQEALKNALRNSGDLPFHLDDYTQYELTSKR